MFSKEEFGLRLKKLRLQRQENQSALAEILGVSVAQISEIENGNKSTTLEKLALICEHYQVSADYLLGFQPFVKAPGSFPVAVFKRIVGDYKTSDMNPVRFEIPGYPPLVHAICRDTVITYKRISYTKNLS